MNNLGRDNLEEMDKFPEIYNPPRLNQEKIENMNRLITSNEIESVIKKFSTNRSPGPDSFTGEFYQTFKEYLSFSNYSKKLKGRNLLNSFYEASITLIPKPGKDSTQRHTEITCQ